MFSHEEESKIKQKMARGTNNNSGNSAPMVLILVPTFNSATFIEKAIDSLVNQTLKEIQICFCDGGSNDGTLDIIRRYSKVDQRITFFSAPGQNILSRFSMAISCSNAEYVGEMDSDDSVDAHMFETLAKNAIAHKADISACHQKNSYNSKRNQAIKSGYFNENEIKDTIFKGNLDSNCQEWGAGFHTIIVKRSILLNNLSYFSQCPNPWCDTVYFYTALLDSNTIFIDSSELYHYQIRTSGSLSSTKGRRFYLSSLETYRILATVFKDKNHSNDEKNVYYILFKIVEGTLFSLYAESNRLSLFIKSARQTASDPFIKKRIKNGNLKDHIHISKAELIFDFLLKHQWFILIHEYIRLSISKNK